MCYANELCWTCEKPNPTHKEYRDALDEYEYTCDECHRNEYPDQYEDYDEEKEIEEMKRLQAEYEEKMSSTAPVIDLNDTAAVLEMCRTDERWRSVAISYFASGIAKKGMEIYDQIDKALKEGGEDARQIIQLAAKQKRWGKSGEEKRAKEW
jgi:hypothetical protein